MDAIAAGGGRSRGWSRSPPRRAPPGERVLVEVVVLDEAGNAALARLRPQQSSCLPLAGQRPVQPAKRLDSHEVAQHEHVQRNLEAQLRLDLRRRMSDLPGLVVLDDPA